VEESCPSNHSRKEGAAPPREVVTVPSRQGLEAADLLRLSTGVGPVFHDRGADSLAFLVPPGTAEQWDLPGSQCHRAAADPSAGGWVVPPHTDTAVTDPQVLRAALGRAAQTIRLADAFAQSPQDPAAPPPDDAAHPHPDPSTGQQPR
jgi:hypothetical protein